MLRRLEVWPTQDAEESQDREGPASSSPALAEHKRRQAEEKLRGGPNYEQHGLVFATPEGRPLWDFTLAIHHYRPILKRAGIVKHLRLYDLRHSFATLSLLASVHPKVVSEALGHTSVAFTMDTYAHVLPTMQEDAARRIAQLLFGGQIPTEEQTVLTGSSEFAHNSHTEEPVAAARAAVSG